MRGFGVDPELVDVFKTQLDVYKDRLIGLYRQKNQLIAERDSKRFRYLSSWRSKIENVLNDIRSEILYQNLFSEAEFWTNVQKNLKQRVPMTTLADDSVAGWGTAPDYILMTGGKVYSFLTSLNRWFNDKTGDRTFWATYKNTILNKQPTKLQGDFLQNIQALGPSGYYSSSLPFSEDFIADLGWTFSNNRALRLELATRIYPIILTDFGQGKLFDILEEGRQLLSSTVNLTYRVFSIQKEIEDLELQVQSFLEEYKGMDIESLLDATELFKELQRLSLQQQQFTQAQEALIVAQNTPIPEPQVILTAPDGDKKTSKVPLIIGAAIGAALLLG